MLSVGAPEPQVNWQVQGVGSLAPELIVDIKIGKTSIFFPAARRSDTGNYQLNLKNEIGEDEGVFEIIVQDRPGPPKGPIQVDDITKSSCVLSWQPPVSFIDHNNYLIAGERRRLGNYKLYRRTSRS